MERFRLSRKRCVVPAELAVAVSALGVGGAVLLPQQLQRHALALELLVDQREVGRGVADRPRRGVREQQRLERRVIEIGGQRRAQPGLRGTLHVAW